MKQLRDSVEVTEREEKLNGLHRVVVGGSQVRRPISVVRRWKQTTGKKGGDIKSPCSSHAKPSKHARNLDHAIAGTDRRVLSDSSSLRETLESHAASPHRPSLCRYRQASWCFPISASNSTPAATSRWVGTCGGWVGVGGLHNINRAGTNKTRIYTHITQTHENNMPKKQSRHPKPTNPPGKGGAGGIETLTGQRHSPIHPPNTRSDDGRLRTGVQLVVGNQAGCRQFDRGVKLSLGQR